MFDVYRYECKVSKIPETQCEIWFCVKIMLERAKQLMIINLTSHAEKILTLMYGSWDLVWMKFTMYNLYELSELSLNQEKKCPHK